MSHSDVDVLIYDILNFGELRTSWNDRNELNGELILANVLFFSYLAFSWRFAGPIFNYLTSCMIILIMGTFGPAHDMLLDCCLLVPTYLLVATSL